MSHAAPKRVLVTRAARQGSDLAEALRSCGCEPVIVPAIERVEPTSYAALDEALAHLDHFDWLLFTSPNAVDALATRIGPQQLSFRGKVAAVGPATAETLHQIGLTADLTPTHAVAEALAEALLPYARRADGTAASFLLVRAEEARDYLPATLRDAGAEVTIAPAYRTVIPGGSKELVRTLFADGRLRDTQSGTQPIAAVMFTSSSTVCNLLALCESAGVRLPSSAKRVSIGPITSRTLRELGLPPHAEASSATIASLVEAVIAAMEAGSTEDDRPET